MAIHKAQDVRAPAPLSENHHGVRPPQSKIPKLGDKGAPEPKAGGLRISPEAVEGRLRRVFTPNVRGEFKVSTAIVQQWRDKRKGRKPLEQIFQSCGYDVDWGYKKYVQAL